MHPTSVLIVSDCPALVRRVGDGLARRRVAARVVASFADARAALAEQGAQLVVVHLPNRDAIAAAEAFACDAAESGAADLLLGLGDVPANEAERLTALGFDDVAREPRHPAQFAARLGMLLRLATMKRELARRHATARRFNAGFAIVSDTLDFAGMVAPPRWTLPTMLVCDPDALLPTFASTINVTHAADLAAAQAALLRGTFDLCVIAAATMPEAAFRLAAAVRRSSSLYHLPVVLAANGVDADAAFEAGVSEIVAPEAFAAELDTQLASVRRLSRLRQRLVDAYRQPAATAVYDNITGLFSRGFVMDHLSTMIAPSTAPRVPLSVGRLGLTSLNAVNVEHGYRAGDHLLMQFGELLRRHLRGEDLAARVGGSEFLIVFPDAPIASARIALGRLASVLRHARFTLPDDGGTVALATSYRVTEWTGDANATRLVEALRDGYAIAA